MAKVMMVVIRLQIKAQLSEDVVKCIYNSVNRTQNIYSKSLQKCIYSRNEAQKSIKLRGKNFKEALNLFCAGFCLVAEQPNSESVGFQNT